jgi:hypothetical protein
MKAIVRRLDLLEQHRALLAPVGYDARAVLLVRLNAMTERMRAGGKWPPEPRPTVEQVRQRVMQALARP